MTGERDPLAVLRRTAEQAERDARFWEILGRAVMVAAVAVVFAVLVYALVKW